MMSNPRSNRVPPFFILFALAASFFACTSFAGAQLNPFAAATAFAAPASKRAELNKKFHDVLTPYGAWVRHATYGSVWRPKVAADWRPYSLGRWTNTKKYGWYWNSDEPFGSVTYHYGCWDRDSKGSWYWAPGYQWAPAWVIWKKGPKVIGWAPMGCQSLRGKKVKETLSSKTRPRLSAHVDNWVFVQPAEMARGRSIRFYPVNQNSTYFSSSTTINNFIVSDDNVIVNRGITLNVLKSELDVVVNVAEPPHELLPPDALSSDDTGFFADTPAAIDAGNAGDVQNAPDPTRDGGPPKSNADATGAPEIIDPTGAGSQVDDPGLDGSPNPANDSIPDQSGVPAPRDGGGVIQDLDTGGNDAGSRNDRGSRDDGGPIDNRSNGDVGPGDGNGAAANDNRSNDDGGSVGGGNDNGGNDGGSVGGGNDGGSTDGGGSDAGGNDGGGNDGGVGGNDGGGDGN